MLDEDNLRRLAEMGIDVYVPRRAGVQSPLLAAASGGVRVADKPVADLVDSNAAQVPANVVVLADATTKAARALVANVVHALGFAGITCAHGQARDEASLAAAHALVMFGDRQVRAAGAVVPAQRQREIGWVVGADLSALAADASAKRALWSELKRMARDLAVRGAAARR